MWTFLSHHAHEASHLVSSPLLAVLGALSLLATETLPGENALLRAGFAAAAVTALAALTVRALRVIRRLNAVVDDFQEIRSEVLGDDRNPSLSARFDSVLDAQERLDAGQAEIIRKLGFRDEP